MRRVTAGDNDDEAGPLEHARVLADRANRLITVGEPGEAERLLHHAHQLFTTAESTFEAAVAMSRVADIAYQRGTTTKRQTCS